MGSFAKAGDMFATDVKVLDVERKKLLKSASSKGKTVDSILERQIDELSREISFGMGISRDRIEAIEVNTVDVTTSSLQAYKYYLEGIELADKFYVEEAVQLLNKAIELDPKFAMAYFRLSWAYSQVGNTKAVNEGLKNAMANAEKIAEKERLLIESRYAQLIEGDITIGIGLSSALYVKWRQK